MYISFLLPRNCTLAEFCDLSSQKEGEHCSNGHKASKVRQVLHGLRHERFQNVRDNHELKPESEMIAEFASNVLHFRIRPGTPQIHHGKCHKGGYEADKHDQGTANIHYVRRQFNEGFYYPNSRLFTHCITSFVGSSSTALQSYAASRSTW